jgi:hypothetical protein
VLLGSRGASSGAPKEDDFVNLLRIISFLTSYNWARGIRRRQVIPGSSRPRPKPDAARIHPARYIDGTGPRDATVTALAQPVPYRWDRISTGQVSLGWAHNRLVTV